MLVGTQIGPGRHLSDDRRQLRCIEPGEIGQGMALDAAVQVDRPPLSKRVGVALLAKTGLDE